jgi:hypothetical protein
MVNKGCSVIVCPDLTGGFDSGAFFAVQAVFVIT